MTCRNTKKPIHHLKFLINFRMNLWPNKHLMHFRISYSDPDTPSQPEHTQNISQITARMKFPLTESLPQSCMALLMIMTEMSCQRTERSVKSSQGWLALIPLVSACSCRISSSSLLWTSQPRRRLRAEHENQKIKLTNDNDFCLKYVFYMKNVLS